MSQIQRTDFAALQRPNKPNTFLMAPEGLCKQAKVDEASSHYGVPATKLRQEFLRIVIAKPRLSHSFRDDAGLYDDFVVRSLLFRFPDLISAQFLDEKGGKSTLAVYSRSVYGHSDLGVNRARTMGWITELNSAIAPVSA